MTSDFVQRQSYTTAQLFLLCNIFNRANFLQRDYTKTSQKELRMHSHSLTLTTSLVVLHRRFGLAVNFLVGLGFCCFEADLALDSFLVAAPSKTRCVPFIQEHNPCSFVRQTESRIKTVGCVDSISITHLEIEGGNPRFPPCDSIECKQ